MIDESVKSFWEWWREKTSSSLYFTYLISFVAWNWKGIYVLLIDDSPILPKERLSYVINELYFGADFPANLLNFSYSIGLPAMSTFLIILLFPKLNEWAHKIEIDSFFKRKQYYLDAESGSIAEVNKEMEIQLKGIKEQLALAKNKSETRKEIMSLRPVSDGWDEDFEDFKKTTLYWTFPQFAANVHERGAYYWDRFKPDELAVADSFSLVKLDKENGTIELTDKGKYFNRRRSQKDSSS